MMIPSFLKQVLYLNFLRQLGEGQAIKKNFFFILSFFFLFSISQKKYILGKGISAPSLG